MNNEKARILLAEDDASLAFMMKDSLEDDGYKVVHCADGQAAIDTFDKTKFDLCLLDIMMPNKDGYTVAKKIRQQTDVLPIIFLSTKSQVEDRLKGYDTGADDYIAKPFNMPELLKKIEVFLRRSKKIFSEKKIWNENKKIKNKFEYIVFILALQKMFAPQMYVVWN